MKYELKGTDGMVIYVADINGSDYSRVNKGRAVMAASNDGVDLRCVDLSNADLENPFCGASLSGVNLSGANLFCAGLCGSDLSNADLSGAEMRFTSVDGADLRGAKLPYYDITPVINDIHKTVYAAAGWALSTSKWHSECGTIHCWAGWIVTLAGEAGGKLEDIIGTGTAAALILMKSDPELAAIPDWHATKYVALSEMARLAGEQCLWRTV